MRGWPCKGTSRSTDELAIRLFPIHSALGEGSFDNSRRQTYGMLRCSLRQRYHTHHLLESRAIRGLWLAIILNQNPLRCRSPHPRPVVGRAPPSPPAGDKPLNFECRLTAPESRTDRDRAVLHARRERRSSGGKHAPCPTSEDRCVGSRRAAASGEASVAHRRHRRRARTL